MPTMPDGYYSRFDPAKNYAQHLFRAGYVLQSAELNEIQQTARDHTRGIADALFKDGNVVRDAQIIVNASTGVTLCEAGHIYLGGAVRSISAATITIPINSVVSVGAYLAESVVTELTDPALRDPALLSQNYEEAGASRLKVALTWGFGGDGRTGEFCQVYVVENGILRQKEPPPQLDGVTQALARYDRDSAGGTYVVNGMSVTAGDDSEGNQIYYVSEGRARVNGYSVESTTGRRVVYPATPTAIPVASEPHLSTTVNAQRVNTDIRPIASIATISITQEKTVTVTHGGYTGASDALPDTSVLSLVSVTQGGTTYIVGTNVKLTNGAVDWSLTGIEPATGSTYSVTYLYINSAPTVTLQDSTGFTVAGAKAGTLILVTYAANLPRWDRLCLNAEGAFVWINGTSSRYGVQIPGAPSGLLPLAAVYQGWDSTKRLQADGTRMIPMQDIASINDKIDLIVNALAKNNLIADAVGRESSATKGMFVDPFFDDSMRDQGITQTAAIVNGELILPIDAVINTPSADIARPITALAGYIAGTTITSRKVLLEQAFRTSASKINPYGVVAILPAAVAISPAVDRWTVVNTTWASASTQRITTGSGNISSSSTATTNALVSSTPTAIGQLRPIDVTFTIAGFGPGEALTVVTFDGIDVLSTVV